MVGPAGYVAGVILIMDVILWDGKEQTCARAVLYKGRADSIKGYIQSSKFQIPKFVQLAYLNLNRSTAV